MHNMVICSSRLAFSVFIGCFVSLLLVWALGNVALLASCLLILTLGLLSAHRLHLQIVLDTLALMQTTFTYFLSFAANARAPWLAKRLWIAFV